MFSFKKIVVHGCRIKKLVWALVAVKLMGSARKQVSINYQRRYNACQKYLGHPAIYAAFDIFHSFHEKLLLQPHPPKIMLIILRNFIKMRKRKCFLKS